MSHPVQATNRISDGLLTGLGLLAKVCDLIMQPSTGYAGSIDVFVNSSVCPSPQMAPSTERDGLYGLLRGQLSGLQALRANTTSLGSDVARVSSSLFDAYKAQNAAATGVLAAGVNGAIDVVSASRLLAYHNHSTKRTQSSCCSCVLTLCQP
jgi:hypothetical protein